MLADLHAHYPMRALEDAPRAALEQMRKVGGRHGFGDKLRALVLKLASITFSNRDWWSGYRITPDYMRQGGVGLAMSVLHRPFEEMDLGKPYGAPPAPGYFEKLLADLRDVEDEVGTHDRAVLRLVHNRAELDQALTDNATALVHSVEGGVLLGDRPEEIEANVTTLAERGVAYVTLAHLFFRQVATNAPALPFLPTDAAYRWLFPQPGEGLTERGEAAVRAMVRNRVMVDISHMSAAAIAETVRLLDEELDPSCEFPLIATHAGYRFGKQEYMLDDNAVQEIKRRDGVIGLIMAQHQLNDGLRRTRTTSLEESFEVVRRHIDEIAKITGDYRHVALGTDFDGFIKPTMGGLETMADLKGLDERLEVTYHMDAELIASGNAIRVLRKVWTSKGPPAPST
jgi:microsomal dipeptidase-like Zn-dependent dipeptidase